MPIPIRRFNLKKLIERLEKQNEASKPKNQLTMKDLASPKHLVPDFVTQTTRKT